MLKTVVLHNVVDIIIYLNLLDLQMDRKFKSSNRFFCNNFKDFTVTFDHFNAFLTNKNMNFLNIYIYLYSTTATNST